MRKIDKILSQLEYCITNNTFFQIESDNIELKDLSQGENWKELYKSINAFLNTRGGIVIIGIKEDIKNELYRFTGFNLNNEPKIKEITGLFTDKNGKNLNLSEYINPANYEFKPFLNGNVLLVFVEKLPDVEKYVFYKDNAYERQITGDHIIPKSKIAAQEELKEELRNRRELDIVPGTTLDEINIDKLNEFINRYNKDKKIETLKSDINSALSFLSRKKFVIDNSLSVLGMLVCGNNVFDYLGGRCQSDCFVDTGIEVAGDKKVYKDNIIQLMEDSIGFLISKIATGISLAKGGDILYEYPERVIRETVNNAFAHRDYKSEKFINITVKPAKNIEIRNPGRFRQEQIFKTDNPVIVRRIIPIPKPQNPNLADVLKSFDRWEGKGWGMASLTNSALNNEIDIPYYLIYSENDIGLFINKGKLYDEEMEARLNIFSKYLSNKTNGRNLTEEQKRVLSYFYKSEVLNRLERYTIILTSDNNHFETIKDLEEYQLIVKISNSPNLYPVYIVDRQLMKKDFSKELEVIFGFGFNSLSNELKDILEVIYQYNEFSANIEANANNISKYLYYHKYKYHLMNIDLDNFKRSIRTKCNKLEKSEFILRDSEYKPNYKLNRDLKNRSMF